MCGHFFDAILFIIKKNIFEKVKANDVLQALEDGQNNMLNSKNNLIT